MSNFKQLPMLAVRLFLWGAENDPRRYRRLFRNFKACLFELQGLMQQQLTLMSDSGRYRVRLEYFFKTRDFSDDVVLPVLSLPDLIWVCDHDRITTHMMSQITAILKPLRDLYHHILGCENGKLEGIRMWDTMGNDLGPNRMTTLIYCLEKAVQYMSIIKNAQYGKITSKIWEMLDSQRNGTEENDLFFAIPEACVIRVKDAKEHRMCLWNANVIQRRPQLGQGRQHGARNYELTLEEQQLIEAPDDSEEEDVARNHDSSVHYLLKNTIYSYKRVLDLSSRLTENDLKRVPRHTQTLGGQMAKDSILPKAEEHLKAKIAQAFFEFSEREVVSIRGNSNPYTIPLFQKRHYRLKKYRFKTVEQIQAFYDTLSCIMWEAYDLSWYAVWKQRKWFRTKNEVNFFTNADMSLENFPTTKKSFDLWHQSQIGPDSCTLVQSNMDATWQSGTARITSSEQLYDHCFKESTHRDKSKWNKLICTRLFKVLCIRLRVVEKYLRSLPNHDRGTIDMWRITYFRDHLYSSMSSQRKREEDDNTMFLVWDLRSTEKNNWSWQRIRPILVLDSRAETVTLPYQASLEPLSIVSGRVCASMENYMFPFASEAEKRKSSGSNPQRDVFFQIIKPPPMRHHRFPYQLNHIIALRTLLAFQDKLQLRNVNTENCPVHLKFNNSSIQFGKVFGCTKKSFTEAFKNTKKRYLKTDRDAKQNHIEKIATLNRSSWDCSEHKELKIFVDEKQKEDSMKYYLRSSNTAGCLRLAHNGIITEDFLVALIALRDKYEEVKGQDLDAILAALGINWMI